MVISSIAVSSLRQRTGVSISACKDALEEAHGDEEKAIEILRCRGLAQAAKKSMRDQKEGRVFSACMPSRAALIHLGCETDFVARDETFQLFGNTLVQLLLSAGKEKTKEEADKKIPEMVQKLGEHISIIEAHLVDAPVLGTYVHSNGKIGVIIGLDQGTVEIARNVAMHAAALNPFVVSPEEISESLIVKEKEIWREQLIKEGKSSPILEKIMVGKEKKFREEHALLKQDFVKEPGKKIEEYLGSANVISYVRIGIGE